MIDISKTCYEYWGEECGQGWKHLIDPLIERCEIEGVKIQQIKEKFGGLRFYVDGGSPELYKMINEAENLSYKTCEQCGEPGSLRRGGWLKTLCDECTK